MSVQVIVRVKGRVGLDDADGLQAGLSGETGLDWQATYDTPAGTLTSPGLLLLHGMLDVAAGKALEMTAESALKRTREVVDRWRERRLDPPDVEIELRETAGVEPDAPGAGEAAG